jgi:hypothetical protein
MMNKYFLSVTTWEGIAPGAVHYYGRIKGEFKSIIPRPKFGLDFTQESYDVERQFPDREGWKTRFDSKDAVIRAAIQTFQRLKLKGLLYIGDGSTAQPQRILIAPRSVESRARQENRLWQRMEHYYNIGGFDPWIKYGKQMDTINKQWNELWK